MKSLVDFFIVGTSAGAVLSQGHGLIICACGALLGGALNVYFRCRSKARKSQ